MQRWKIGAAVIVAAAVVGGGVAVAAQSGSSDEKKDLIVTAAVQRRTLKDEVTLTGTLARKEERQVTSVTQGRVSSVDVDDGAVVEIGQPMLALDGRQAIAVVGDTPFFRPLDVGDKGEDVRQLERVLAAAGYSPGPIDTRYTEQTRFALAQWQAEHGYPGAKPITAQTVTVSLSQSLGYTLGPHSSTGFIIGASAPAPSDVKPGSAQAVPAFATGARAHIRAASRPASRRFGNPGDPVSDDPVAERRHRGGRARVVRDRLVGAECRPYRRDVAAQRHRARGRCRGAPGRDAAREHDVGDRRSADASGHRDRGRRDDDAHAGGGRHVQRR